MKIVIADCSAVYTGRGDTQLPRGRRAIIIKQDGSVSIHNDAGNKPLNYMKNAEILITHNDADEQVWHFDARNESLAITMHEILSEYSSSLITDDPGLQRDGTEKDLQEWISRNPHAIHPQWTFVSQEYRTDNGPVDLLMLDENQHPVVVEVKRTASPNAVYQVKRYVDALVNTGVHEVHDLSIDMSAVRGIIAASEVRPKAQELALKRGIAFYELGVQWKM